MSTFADVGRDVVSSISTDAPSLLAAQWAIRRYQQLVSQTKFRHLRKVGHVSTQAEISTGVATVVRGSSIVTGDAAAQATWVGDLSRLFFRARSVWYPVSGVVGSSIILSTPFTEEDITAGTYKIIQRFVQLPPAVKHLGETFVHFRFHRPITKTSAIELDMNYSERLLVGSPPDFWCETEQGIDSEGARVRQVEFYPIPTTAETYGYIYWEKAQQHKHSDELPIGIDSYVLKEGALIDLYRFEMSQSIKKGDAVGAGIWRNESRAQSTSWKDQIQDAARSDRGSDDITLILNTLGPGSSFGRAITTAREDVFAGGNRP